MKELTKIAAAVSLLLAAGSASAAWNDGSTVGTPSSVAFQISDNSDSANANSQKTFILDLAVGHAGLNYASFQNGTQGAGSGLSWDLSALGGSLFSGFAPDTADFKWSVVASYKYDGDTGTNVDKNNVGEFGYLFSDPNNAQWGVQTTVHNPLTDLSQQSSADIQAAADPTFGNVSSWINRIIDPAGANNAAIASVDKIGGLSFYDSYLSSLGALGGNHSFTGASSANFYGITNPNINETNNTITQLGTFSLSAGNVLTYAPAAVPLPAGVWLFLSGLIGVLGFNRKRSVASAA